MTLKFNTKQKKLVSELNISNQDANRQKLIIYKYLNFLEI